METWTQVESAAPAIGPITVGGWYECTDGTWVEVHWGGRLHGPREVGPHYNRPPTPEERDAAIRTDGEAYHRTQSLRHDAPIYIQRAARALAGVD